MYHITPAVMILFIMNSMWDIHVTAEDNLPEVREKVFLLPCYHKGEELVKNILPAIGSVYPVDVSLRE